MVVILLLLVVVGVGAGIVLIVLCKRKNMQNEGNLHNMHHVKYTDLASRVRWKSGLVINICRN